MKFLPQRAPIESFGLGGFRFAGMSHQGSLLILPSGMRAWPCADIAAAGVADFAAVVAEKDGIDFLVIGTGAYMRGPPAAVMDYLAASGVRANFMNTSSAIHDYNIVLAEGRRVAAALVVVARAHDGR